MTPFWQTTDGAIRTYVGDSLALLREMPSESVHCCVTSPPYFGLRDYGVDGQIGLESSPDEFVAKLVELFREVRRVLHPSGTCWVNMGDSYSGRDAPGWRDGNESKNGGNSNKNGVGMIHGLKPKDLIGVPWLLAFALRADGWYLRQDIIWHKPAPMPESVTDRCTKAHEYVFLLTKSARYFYDAEAVKEAAIVGGHRYVGARDDTRMAFRSDGGKSGSAAKYEVAGEQPQVGNGVSRNRRSVWTVASEPFPGSHFATFPSELIRPMIRAGTSEWGCCPKCLAPWVRVVEREKGDSEANHRPKKTGGMNSKTSTLSLSGNGSKEWAKRGTRTTVCGWQPSCECVAGDPIPCTVIDPFGGSGTTGMVARQEGRACIMLELNPEYAKMHRERVMQIKVMTEDDAPLFSKEFA